MQHTFVEVKRSDLEIKNKNDLYSIYVYKFPNITMSIK